ncbi:487_t:CDS:2 [Rhizophagus irregularis]|nr:487_t:CDS:2 [Rhizophagus irregularis]
MTLSLFHTTPWWLEKRKLNLTFEYTITVYFIAQKVKSAVNSRVADIEIIEE